MVPLGQPRLASTPRRRFSGLKAPSLGLGQPPPGFYPGGPHPGYSPTPPFFYPEEPTFGREGPFPRYGPSPISFPPGQPGFAPEGPSYGPTSPSFHPTPPTFSPEGHGPEYTPTSPSSPLSPEAPAFQPTVGFLGVHEENAARIAETLRANSPEQAEEFRAACARPLLRGAPVPGNMVRMKGRLMVVGTDGLLWPVEE
jgi:hypothetical protein